MWHRVELHCKGHPDSEAEKSCHCHVWRRTISVSMTSYSPVKLIDPLFELQDCFEHELIQIRKKNLSFGAYKEMKKCQIQTTRDFTIALWIFHQLSIGNITPCSYYCTSGVCDPKVTSPDLDQKGEKKLPEMKSVGDFSDTFCAAAGGAKAMGFMQSLASSVLFKNMFSGLTCWSCMVLLTKVYCLWLWLLRWPI